MELLLQPHAVKSSQVTGPSRSLQPLVPDKAVVIRLNLGVRILVGLFYCYSTLSKHRLERLL
jgi:hypothetical protein